MEKSSALFKLIPFIKCAMSDDYFSMLPENFFEIFLSNHCVDNFDNEPVEKNIIELNSAVLKIKKLFTASSYCVPDHNIYLSESLNNNGAEILIKDFSSNSSYIKKHSLSKKALDEIYNILSILYKIDSKNSESLISIYNEIKNLLQNDYSRKFPRSYLNFSVFQYVIKGYPYKTISNRIWSISNIKQTTNDEDKIDIYFKNINAIIDGLYHLDTDSLDDKTILRNSICSIILLSALYSEESYKQEFIRNIFKVNRRI